MENGCKRILVSFIIPVYNVEHYLRKCVQSVIDQGDFDGAYEIILIDDGSSDSSGQICEELSRKCPFVQVQHQENAGLGAARNAGIRSAGGEFLLFLDADDFIGVNSLGKILHKIQKNRADVYFLNSYKYFGPNRVQAMNDSQLRLIDFLEKENGMKLLAGLRRYPGSACDKLIRRSMIEQHRIFFEEGVVGEDLVWVLKCLLYAQSWHYLDVDYYYYRQNRAGSITSCCDPGRFADQIHAVRQGIALAKTAEGKRFQKEIYSMMAYEAEIALLFFGMLQKQERQRMEVAEDVLELLKYRDTGRTKWIRWSVSRIGVRKTAKLLKCGYCLKNRFCGKKSLRNYS